jgi:predicted GNAT family N-acyltransferase
MLKYEFIDYKNARFSEEAYPIRKKVFVEEQEVPEEIELDEYDKEAAHIIVYNEEKPIATARLAHINGEYHVGRVAVLKHMRGKDIGKFMMEKMIEKARDMGVKKIVVDAQLQAMEFLGSLVF